MGFKVVSEEWDYDFSTKTLEECTLYENDDLEECIIYARENNIPEYRIVDSKIGRKAIGDWYGAYDNDLGWEYD